MPRIEPFCGVHYDPLRTYGLSPVIGPPDDLPNLEEAERMVRQHPYHSLRLELGNPTENGWTDPADVRAQIFDRWVADGTLVCPEEPAFFVHEHRYRHEGIYHRRLGLFVAADLDDSEESGFRPHEGTIPENLRFRTELLRNVRLSISPIFTLVRDKGKLGAVLADLVHARPPDLSGHDAEEGVHRVWVLRDPHLITWFQDLIAGRPLYIADGHHRLAAARTYRDDLIGWGKDPGPARRVLTLIVSESDPGVSILPIHRGVSRLPAGWESLDTHLERLFEIECVLKRDQINPDLISRRAQRLSESTSDHPEFLLFRHDDQRLMRIRLRDWKLIDDLLDGDRADEVRKLDVMVAHRVLLEHLLGIPREDPEEIVRYNPDAEELTRQVKGGEVELGIFMLSVRIEQVLAVADAGATMPQKSTYFYPKVPAGLVMYDLG